MAAPAPAAARAERRATFLLVAGTVAGVALAAFGILRSGEPPASLPDDAVALVNGQPISRDAFADFVGAVAAERRTVELDPEEKARLLERMVDEELLLQRGIELGLARYERTARRAIVAAVVAAVTADAESEEPDEEALRRFHEERGERFVRPGRVSVDVVFASVAARPEALAFRHAAELAARLRAGEDAAAVAAAGDALPAPVPAGPVSLEELRGTLGPSAALAAERLAPGETSDPVRGAAGYAVLRLRERLPGALPPFEEVREQVRAEYLREVGERALAEYLRELRANAEVSVRDGAVAATPPS